jgi:hypothetical protein
MIRLTVVGDRATGAAGCGVMGVRDVSRYPLATSLNRRKVSM